MERLIVVESKQVSDSDIAQALELDRITYPGEYQLPLERCIAWNRRNDRIYTMLRDDATNRIIAYVNVCPITEEYYERIRSGTFYDTDLPENAVMEYSMPALYDLYFSSIVVHPDYRSAAVFALLFRAIMNKFIALGKAGFLARRMLADAVTEKGEKFCELFGMERLYASGHQSSIFEVQMMPPRFRVSSRLTRELFDFYSAAARDLGLDDAPAAPARQAPLPAARDAVAPVFISYSSRQSDSAQRVCDYLERHGVRCWIAPRDIRPGGNYATQIVHAIRGCRALVLLASENTNVSGHVSNEVSLAFDCKKVIVPFKLEDLTFSDEYLYFLGRKHWIDAFADFDQGLKSLLQTLSSAAPAAPTAPDAPARSASPVQARPQPGPGARPQPAGAGISRQELTERLKENTRKYSYCILDRCRTEEEQAAFEQNAERMFRHSLRLLRMGKTSPLPWPAVAGLEQAVLRSEPDAGFLVQGLPGSAKNMLLQLTFLRLLRRFCEGESDLVPCYISLAWFEKADYDPEQVARQMKQKMQQELAPFLAYLQENPGACGVVLVDAVRQHITGPVLPENVLLEVLRPLGSFRRVLAMDTGLIKNRLRLKKVIPLAGPRLELALCTQPLDISDRENCLDFIDAILTMYNCLLFDAQQLYDILMGLRCAELDIFLVRMVARELAGSFSGTLPSAAEIYERMALSEWNGDEEALAQVAEHMFRYLFDDAVPEEYLGRQWALVHKHHTYMQFLTAYYFLHSFRTVHNAEEADFFHTMLTDGEGTFLVQLLREDLPLQERLFRFIVENYESFDVRQKSNGAYWLGRLTSKNLKSRVVQFLTDRFNELRPLVKANDQPTGENMDRQFLFRAISTGLLFQGQAAIMDEYLCQLLTSDMANAINRGAVIEYYGDTYQMAANDSYYLDTDLQAGERAMRALTRRIESSLYRRDGKFVENNLITLATLLQARIQAPRDTVLPQLRQYVESMVRYIETYRTLPQHIFSNKIDFYLYSVLDDFRAWLEDPSFDVGQKIYNRYRSIKDVKRLQWTAHNVEDPESVSEHTYSAWLMAMLFLPEVCADPAYSKREILDMLLIHDLAEADLGDRELDLSEPQKDLKEQNTILRKLFIKGTYPELANLTYYYNIWTGYYTGANLNAKIARDINVIQTVYTFFEYYLRYPQCFCPDDVALWKQNQQRLSTDIGFGVWEKLISGNVAYRQFFQ